MIFTNTNQLRSSTFVTLICIAALYSGTITAQVVGRGLAPAGNTLKSFQNGSIARDSGVDQPLDLLNDFYPAIEVTVSDNDNVRQRPGFQEDDIKWEIRPSLGYRTNIGRHQFYAAYNGTFVYHDELDQEDAQAHELSANLGLDLSRYWDIDLFASIGETFEQRGISGSRNFSDFINLGIDSRPEEIEFNRFGADLVFGRKIGIITGVLGFDYAEANFSSSDLNFGIDEQGRDRETESIHLDIDWQFGSRTSVFGRVQRTDVDYTSVFSDLDAEQTDYLFGFRVKPTSTLSGVVGIGRTDRDFDAVTREDFDGTIYYGNLNYAFSPLSNLQLAASRAVEEPGAIESDFFVSDLLGASWTHTLSERLIFDIYGKIIEDDYNDGRRDEFQDWGLGLDFVFRNWLTVGIYYGEVERESSLTGIDFENQFIGLRLRSDLRSFFSSRRKHREPDSFGYTRRTRVTQSNN